MELTHTDARGRTERAPRSEREDAKQPALPRGPVLCARPVHLHRQLTLRSAQLHCSHVALLILSFHDFIKVPTALFYIILFDEIFFLCHFFLFSSEMLSELQPAHAVLQQDPGILQPDHWRLLRHQRCSVSPPVPFDPITQ